VTASPPSATPVTSAHSISASPSGEERRSDIAAISVDAATAMPLPFVRRLTIRARLGAAASFAMIALLGMAALATLTIGQLAHEFDAFVQREWAAQAGLARLQLLIGELRGAEKDTVLSIDDLDTAKRHHQRWIQGVAAVRQALVPLRASLPAPTVDRIDAQVARYAALAGEVLHKGIAGLIVTSTEEHQALQPARDALDQATPALDAAAAELARAAQARQARVTNRAAQAPWTLAGLAALTVLLLGCVLWAVVRSVTRPLGQAVRMAHHVADGDLDTPLDTSGRDELSALMRALALMQERLRDVVGRLSDTSRSVAGASAEVSAGSLDLSARTEHTAAQLRQSAASIDALQALVRRAEAEAQGATDVSEQAQALARDGMTVVGDVAARMAALSQRSRRIADITGVIDAIAFQTNLLALNAAVEAARAGPQGRGFAVVAGEVRALAGRATAAAAEIRGLIDSSVDEIGSGARRAEDAGRRMQALIDVIQRLAAGMGPLAEAARAQRRDVAEVHAAMGSLQGVTQQNATLVLQSLASAQALKAQAEDMAGLVGRFRLGATATPG
jgi:methyl-accepting chemotaxis protein